MRRRRARLAILAFIALVVVLVARSGLRALQTVTPEAAPEPTPVAHPLVSAWLHQGTDWTISDERRVVDAAAPIVNGAGFPPLTAAVLIDARNGRTLYAHNAHRALAPASTIKLLVAADALRTLGPQYRFTTQLVTDAPVDGGIVRGDVYLVGGGDPELATDDIRAAIRSLKREGIRLVNGSVVADGSLYGAESVNRTWDPEDLQYGWAAPASAVTIDNGAVQFTIVPDADGGLASVDVDPPGAGTISGHVRTGSADSENTLRIDPLADGSGFSLSGSIPYGAPQKYWRSIVQPSNVAATVVRDIALQGGVAVGGGASVGKAPAGARTVLWSHRSRPLSLIIQRMLRDSDNHIAEQLFRAIAAWQSGLGSEANAVRAEHAYLSTIGANDAGLRIEDGSGLSERNRITAATLAAVLRDMVAQPDPQQAVALLPRVALDGTVRFRPLASDALGRVRGKDGYIEGASGLAGYVETAHHGLVAYAFLVTDWTQGLDAVWTGEDTILDDLARM